MTRRRITKAVEEASKKVFTAAELAYIYDSLKFHLYSSKTLGVARGFYNEQDCLDRVKTLMKRRRIRYDY